MTATPAAPNAAAPATQTIFCPSCLTRMKIRADFPEGKRVRCPKCQQPVDPHTAASKGSNRLKTQQALAKGDDPGLPEWVWAVIIGSGGGLFLGAMVGWLIGMLIAYSPAASAAGPLAQVWFWVVIGSLGYMVYGSAISLTMLFTGGSVGGYAIAAIGAIPVTIFLFIGLGRTGGAIGLACTIGFAVAIERAIDYKLYS